MTLIQAHDVSLSFGKTIALNGVDVSFESGSIIGIAGPNGAGKSTLTRVLAGEALADGGVFELDGVPWDPSLDFETVAVVHQEPQIWPNMTVAQNLALGQEGRLFGSFRATPRAVDVLSELDLLGMADQQLELCSLATRQRVEIGRAMLRQARCYIFDEPNSALTETESDALFAFMRHLAATGHISILITHRLNDLVGQCSRVDVIRDGRVAATLSGDELTEERIASELVTGSLTHTGPIGQVADAKLKTVSSSLTIHEWTSKEAAFAPLDLVLNGGEVTVVVGVEGSGGREFVASTAGFHRASGECLLSNSDESGGLEAATTFLPADRRGMLFDNLTVGDNITSRLDVPRIASRIIGWLRLSEKRRLATDGIARFGVKTEGPLQPLTALSGGNQQKVAIAAALVSDPLLIAIEEPTRGVDVGSKQDIYATLRDAAASGLAVLLFCTETPEAFDVADRLLVMGRGRIIGDMQVADFESVAELAQRVAQEERTR